MFLEKQKKRGEYKQDHHIVVWSDIKLAIVQLSTGPDREINLQRTRNFIKDAKHKGAKLVVLPECFNSPYGNEFFKDYAEFIPEGPTCKMLSNAAKEYSVYIVGGSIPETDGLKYYNTCTVWDTEGNLVTKYRKMHLCDINIPNEFTLRESEILSAGDALSTFEIDDSKIGLGICHDIKFVELATLYRLQGCEAIIYPSAFNMSTGSLHWDLLQKARALDNQLFVIGASPARGDSGHIAWGHSQVTGPWGTVVCQLGHGEDILFCNIDLAECDKARQQLPLLQQRRDDIYATVMKCVHEQQLK